VVKAKRKMFPGIYIVLALIVAAVALGFYGNRIAAQPKEVASAPQSPATPTPTETPPPEPVATPPTNETLSTTPVATETTPATG